MNVLYSTDENYAKLCATSLLSLLDNNTNVKELKIYIIDNKITQKSKQKIIQIAKDYNRTIIFIPCEEVCKDFKIQVDFPLSAYARIFVQNHIKEDKIIYMDCDTIVTGCLEKMWEIDLKNNLVAGVQDPIQVYAKKAIGMKEDDRYINSGVLIINLKEWRKIDFYKKVIEFIKEHNNKVVHHDQGIINGICKGRILYLNPNYNLMPELIMMNEKQLKKLYKMKNFYNEKELENGKENPYIIHYIPKFYNHPWVKECTHPYKQNYLKYYNKLHNKIGSKPLKRKAKMRKFVFDHFPFFVYVIEERILDYKRELKMKKRMK